MSKLRFGILSTGNIAKQFCTGVLESERCELAAVGSRSQASADTFAQQFNIPQAVASYDALINLPGVDAIYTGLPNMMHHEWTIKALNAGKHVLCEKPLAPTYREAKEMFAAAKANNRVLIEAFMYRAHPQTQAVAEAITEGAIGKLQLIRTSFCFNLKTQAGNIRFDPALCGGAIMDIGCYCMNLSNLLAQTQIDNQKWKMENPKMQIHSVLSDTGVDQLTTGMIDYGDGLLSTFQCGMAAQAQNHAMLCGDQGYITVDIPWKPENETAGYTINRQTPPKQDGPQKGNASKPPEEFIATPTDKHLYGVEADAFAATVLDGAAAFMPEADSLQLAGMLEEARRLAGLAY